jgi:excisionase family DNA binding protein
MKPLFDVNSAAHLLAVSPWTVRAYIRQGKLHPVRIGRLVRLDEQELQDFVAGAKCSDGVATNNSKGEEQ